MTCKAKQYSDQMSCECGNVWDVNDPHPPECKRDILDQLAIEVAKTCGNYHDSEDDVAFVEFARRYRAALVDRMEPVAWIHPSSQLFTFNYPFSKPLYSLEGWKK